MPTFWPHIISELGGVTLSQLVYNQNQVLVKVALFSEDAAGFLHLQTNMPNPYLGNDKIKIVKFSTFTYFVNLQDLPDRF